MKSHVKTGTRPNQATVRDEKTPISGTRKADQNTDGQASGPPQSPIRFAMLWFALPVVLLVLMALLGHRSG
jgi:hypothetical protein